MPHYAGTRPVPVATSQNHYPAVASVRRCVVAEASTRIVRGEDRMLTVNQVARMLAVSNRWVYDAAASARLPNFKVGNLLRFSEREMVAWLKSRRTDVQG